MESTYGLQCAVNSLVDVNILEYQEEIRSQICNYIEISLFFLTFHGLLHSATLCKELLRYVLVSNNSKTDTGTPLNTL